MSRSKDATPDPIIAAIRDRLIANGQTQRNLAGACQCSEKHISFVLNGRTDPSMKMLRRMLDFVALDVEVKDSGAYPDPSRYSH